MPIVAAVAAVLGFMWLAYKPAPNITNASIPTPPTPPNGNAGGTGITTGFATPPIQTSVSAPIPATRQSNAPGTAASGVPNYSANAQEFDTGAGSPTPGLSVRPSYYNPNQLNPIYSFTKAPASSVTRTRSVCGGSCATGCQGSSDCAISSERNQDQGCMVPTTRSLIRSTSPAILQNWADNISSSGAANTFAASQQLRFDQQNSNPQGEDTTLPAAATLTGIGLHYGRKNHAAASY
jgi:hypothetical protein